MGERGVWQGVFEALVQEFEDALVFIDASIVKAHRAAAGSKKRNWKKVLAAHEAVARAKFTQLWTLEDARGDWRYQGFRSTIAR